MKEDQNMIDRKRMSSMLKCVYLGGVIRECFLEIKKGKATVKAIDMSNSVIVSTNQKVSTNRKLSHDFGIGDIELLIKFLDSIEQKKLNLAEDSDGNRMVLSRKDGKRRLNYLLTEASLIATRVDTIGDGTETEEEALLDLAVTSALLTSSFIKDFLSYISALKTKEIIVTCKGKTVSFSCGDKTSHLLKIELSNEAEKKAKVKIHVNGEYLSKILSTIEFEEDNPPKIMLGDETLIIKTDSCFWAIEPLSEED